MPLILCIDTAQESASVCIADGEMVLQSMISEEQKNHAAWLHEAIQTILLSQNIGLKDLSAVSVSNGPGSYTGLRVGLSTAKGLCYSLNIPLLTLSTLQLMANAVKENDGDMICPMIDARRMEVFAAVYDKQLHEKISPGSKIIDENSFHEILSNNILIFTGSGSKKLKQVLFHPNARFVEHTFCASDQAKIAFNHFNQQQFADLAYAEPFYIKEFYSPAGKPFS